MFTIHAGDFQRGKAHVFRQKAPFQPALLMLKNVGRFWHEKVRLSEVEVVEKASEETVTRLGGAIGWGLAGAAVLGPFGLLAGLIAGGKSNEVTFVCKLKDGRRFLATARSSIFQQLAAACFQFDAPPHSLQVDHDQRRRH